MRRLITLIFAGRNRIIVTRRELPRTENASWVKRQQGTVLKRAHASSWESLRSELSTDWKSTVMPILEHFVDRTPGSFVEEKKHSLVWHYGTAEPEFGAWLANELVAMLEAMLAQTELRAFRGEKVVEVKPVWANKGEVVERLVAAQPEADFVFAAGDERADEDLFERLGGDPWTLHVGPGSTRAAFVAPNFGSVRELLGMFAETIS